MELLPIRNGVAFWDPHQIMARIGASNSMLTSIHHPRKKEEYEEAPCNRRPARPGDPRTSVGVDMCPCSFAVWSWLPSRTLSCSLRERLKGSVGSSNITRPASRTLTTTGQDWNLRASKGSSTSGPNHYIRRFFDSFTRVCSSRILNDASNKTVEVGKAEKQVLRANLTPLQQRLPSAGEERKRLEEAQRLYVETRKERSTIHQHAIVLERLAVIESIIRLLPPESASPHHPVRDLRRFLAEAELMLDLQGDPPLFVPMEQPLLQAEVLDQLLPRLSAQYPERARELIKAYHNALRGAPLDSVFSEAFKTLEEIARSITGERDFVFRKAYLDRHFPNLHPTIHETMIRLSGHRGDEAGHGRRAPDVHEIRYLLSVILRCSYWTIPRASDGGPVGAETTCAMTGAGRAGELDSSQAATTTASQRTKGASRVGLPGLGGSGTRF